MSQIAGIILALYIFIIAFNFVLDYLNVRSMRAPGKLPEVFTRYNDADVIARAGDYMVHNTWFGVASSVYNNALLLVFIFCGFLELYDRWIRSLGLGFIASGLLFFIPIFFSSTILNVPFALYRTFVLERRHGFSTTTPALWATDLLKSTVISLVIFALVASVGLWVVMMSPGSWWLWLWGFFLAFTVSMMYLSPYIIEPLFYKFTPIDDPELLEGIKGLLRKAGIRVSRVFKMDASRRTSHTNAYFAGLGSTKRIVLYDTLLEKLSKVEILAVLAHEAGHWKRRHLMKRLIFMEAASLLTLYVSFQLLGGGYINPIFGIEEGTFYSGVFLVGFISSIVLFPLSPVFFCISRRHETEADRYAGSLTRDPESMVLSLVKLSRDNLSNPRPHPLYVVFHYTHPPVVDRIRKIEEAMG